MKENLSEMQKEVDDYIQQFKVGYFTPLNQMARMTEEVGELAREISHYYGQKQKKTTEKPKTVAEELGDVLIVTIMMANSLNIDLTETFNENMAKFYKRDHDRFERKEPSEGEAHETSHLA